MNALNFRGLFLCETTSMKMFHNAKFKAGQKTGAGKKEAERARGREIERGKGDGKSSACILMKWQLI